MPTIRFVYFDLGNVLVSFDRGRACRNVAKLFGGDAQEIDDLLHADGLQDDLESGRVSESEFAAIIRTKMSERREGRESNGDGSPLAAICDDAILSAVSDMFAPIESMQQVLANVRRSGIALGILSNTCDAHWNWIQTQAYAVMEGPFDVCVVSYEVKSMKPERLIYQRAESLAKSIADASANEILFLDDREENILAARQFGWNAEVCVGGREAHDILLRYGVLPVGTAFVERPATFLQS